jgi:hypothetical protein
MITGPRNGTSAAWRATSSNQAIHSTGTRSRRYTQPAAAAVISSPSTLAAPLPSARRPPSRHDSPTSSR